MKEIPQQASFRKKALYVILALLLVAVIATFFLLKILTMKQFIFGDDFQMLKWFHEGRIALPMRTIVQELIKNGRFFPLLYQHFNLVSLLDPHLTLKSFAQCCYYVQGGMWIACCAAFTALMTLIANAEKTDLHPAWRLFLPLALLTLLGTPAFVSYFTMLIFPETLLCVLFPLFFIFYYLAWKKENSLCYLLAWGAATAAIFCKENVIAFFAVICGVWGLFGWKILSKKHKLFLAGLLVSIAGFLLLYYFIVYHNIVEAYNTARLWGRSLLEHVGVIFGDHPIWIAGFLLGICRVIRVVFCRDKKHLFMDAMLFAVLGFFLSYLALQLVDWWYWGLGVSVLMPVFYYWLTASEKRWQQAAICLITMLCFAVNVKPAYQRMEQTRLAQQKDSDFLEKIDSAGGVKRILFPMLGNREENIIEDACYKYLKVFLEKLGTPGKWGKNVIQIRDLPARFAPEEICVISHMVPPPPQLQYNLQMSGFQRIASCDFYEAFACCSSDLEAAWQSLPESERRIPCRAPFCCLGKGFAVPEDWGCWTSGKQAELLVAIPPELRGKDLEMTWDIYAFVHKKSPKRKFRILTDDKLLYSGESTQFSGGFTLNVPAQYTGETYLPLAIEIEEPVSPRSLGVSEDQRPLGIGIKNITIRENDARVIEEAVKASSI